MQKPQNLQQHRLKGNGFGYALFDKKSEYTNTISARYYKDGAEVLIEKTNNSNPRKLTPNEARRLQGFPDWFQVNKSDIEAYKQFGNAVPVPVIRAIAERMVEFI